MKKRLIFYIVVLCNSIMLAQNETYNLVNKDGYFVEEGSNKPFTGTNTMYYKNGKIHRKASFKDGLMHGEVLQYFKNGKLSVRGAMKNGVKSGKWTSWYENGEKLREGNFVNNNEEGLFTWWYKNGEVEKKGVYINGSTNGLWTWYYKNGNKEQEGHLLNGQNTGVWTWWHDNGDIRGSKDYSKDYSKDITLSNIEKELVGTWLFKHAIDSLGHIVKSYIKEGPKNMPEVLGMGGQITVNIEKSSDIVFNKNKTFEKIFNESNREGGTWKLKGKKTIEYTNVYERGSRGYKMMKSAERMLPGRINLEYNNQGDIIEKHEDKIIHVEGKKLKLAYEAGLFLIYEKKE